MDDEQDRDRRDHRTDRVRPNFYDGGRRSKGDGNCFGVLELVNKVSAAAGPKLPERVIKPHGYCIDVDADGDQIVFKDANEERPWSSPESPSHSEIVMGTGKYAGITGTSVATCLFGGSMPSTGSSPTSYQRRCDVETTYKLP
jgi:hypothetical protein